MIRKKERIHSETGTTIDQGVEVVQRGILVTTSTAGKVFSIPCRIPNPEVVILTPRSDLSGLALNSFSCDFAKHYASGAVGFGSLSSLSNLAEAGYRTRMHRTTYQLYTILASLAAASLASDGALDTYVTQGKAKKEAYYVGNTEKLYLNITVGNAGSGSFKAKKQFFSYEIRGYEL